MQNQQIQQNPQNGTQPFFPMGQGPNNFDPRQIGSENNFNAPDSNIDTQQGSEISSQIGGTAISRAAINGAATGASQVESPIPSAAQESLDTQTLPNATDDGIQESISNSEVSGVKPEAANIIPSPSPESQAQKKGQKAEDQASTDGVNKIVPLNDALNRKDLPVIEKIAKEVEDNPAEAYGRIVDLRTYFSNEIRRIRGKTA